MIFVIENASLFGAVYLLVFIGLWLIGYAAAQLFSPLSLKPYTIFLAPIWGMTLIIAILTPLSLLGVPLRYVNWVVYFAAALLTLYISVNPTFEKKTNPIKNVTRHQIIGVVSVIVLTAIGGYIVLFVSPNMSYNAARGSSDLLDYWAVADYANHFGGRLEDYLGQSIFNNKVIYEHITYWERWGTMAFLEFFSSLISSKNIYILVNPIILASKAALVLFFMAVAIKSRMPVYPIAILLCITPITYSNLYFTYMSYAVALPIVALCGWTIYVTLNESELPTARVCIGIGILIGVSLVSHSVAFSSLCFAFGFIAVNHLYGNRFRIINMTIGAYKTAAWIVLPSVPYAILYGKQVTNVMRDAGKPANAGWLWERLPMSQDILGFGNTLGFDQLGPQFSIPAQIALGGLAIFLFLEGIRRTYGWPAIFSFPLFSLAILPKYIYEYFIDKNPLASHIVAKLVFSFSDFFIFAIAAGGQLIIYKIPKATLRIAIQSGWIITVAGFLFITTPLPIFYEHELIELLQKHTEDAAFFINTPELDALSQQYRFVPILRNEGKLVSSVQQLRAGVYCRKPLLFLWRSSEENLHGPVISTQGKYSLGLPPSTLDFTQSPGTISLISGFNYWQNNFRLVAKSASLVLRPTKSDAILGADFELTLSATAIVNDSSDATARQSPLRITAIINNNFQTPFDLHTGDNDISLTIPKEVISTCESYTFVEFNVAENGLASSPTNKLVWSIKHIDLAATR